MARASSDPVPSWLTEAFEHLDLVERALALALIVPRSPIGKAFTLEEYPKDKEAHRRAREKAQVALGRVFATLLALLSRNQPTLLRLAGAIREIGAGDGLGAYFLLSIDQWGGSVSHREMRTELIARLIEMREQIIERLRVLSDDPRSRPIASTSTSDDALSEADRVPGWSELTDTQQDILRALSVKRLGRKALAESVSKSDSMVQKALSELTARGVTDRVAGGGYITRTPPIGAPLDVRATP